MIRGRLSGSGDSRKQRRQLRQHLADHGFRYHEVCRKALEYPPGRYALRFLGTIPEDMVLVL